MELKRFIAENSREALQQVKQKHGDDALIISTTKVGKKTEVICAIEESVNNEKTDAKEKDGATLSDDKSETSTAPKTEVHRDELSSIEFSEQLGRIAVSYTHLTLPTKRIV